MNWVSTCAVVIPCLNEQAAIASLVAGIRRHLPMVIVVDDGSDDKTALLAAQAGAEVIHQDRTQGKGAALQAGWRLARERGFHWALSLDGDGQHAPEDIPAFFDCAEKKRAALVVGNRMANPQEMPWLRRRTNLYMSARISKVAGKPLPDTQCGFRLMNLEAWSDLKLTAAHFEIESEVLVAFIAAGHPVEFVPIQVIYKSERSKIHPLRDTVRWLRWWSGARRSVKRKK